MVSGVLVALATPVDADGRLDRAGLERLLERVLAGGVAGVCPTGSTGEGPRLGAAGRLAVVEAVRTVVPAGTPVIPAPAAQTVDDAIAELEAFAAAGCDGALVAPPSYYPLRDEGVRRFYEGVAEHSPLPLLVYNIPGFTKVAVAPAVVGALAAHPRIAGIKDSSRDLEYFTAVCDATAGADRFARLTGSDSLLMAATAIGADGAITASANLAPTLPLAVHGAARAGEWARARAEQQRLFALAQACRVGEPPAGWKAALELAGVCSSALAAPASGLDADERAALRERLAPLDVL